MPRIPKIGFTIRKEDIFYFLLIGVLIFFIGMLLISETA